MKRKPVIAIDGHSSTGKSSISKEIALRLGLFHMDTGALYRGVTFFALENCKNDGEISLPLLEERIGEIELEFKDNEGSMELFLGGRNITSEIRSLEVSQNVSVVAKEAFVRNYLLETQRAIARKGGVIMDGRDIGTTVLPDADYKFFLTASIEERTKRRFLELQSDGVETTLEDVRENLLERDKMDSEREVSPLRQAEDALLIDNSSLTKEETIEKLLSYIER